VIPVDDDLGPVIGHGSDDGREVLQHVAAVEEHLAHQHQVVPAPRHGGQHPLGERLERLGRNDLDLGLSGFLPAQELAPSRVELGIRGQHAERALALDPRDQAEQELMRGGREGDAPRVGPADPARHPLLEPGEQLAEDHLPLAIEALDREVGRSRMPLQRPVQPPVVAVRGEVQAVGVGRGGSLEQVSVTHRSGAPATARWSWAP